MTRTIYMDANATTPLLPEVVAAMAPFWTEHFGNPSSVHGPGQRARAALDQAREQVAGLLACRPSEVLFTSGGTESDNLALLGSFPTPPADGPLPHLIVSAIEHDAVLEAAKSLRQRGAADLTLLPCTPEGVIQPETLQAALTPRTRLVSVMLANNETGVLQPVARLAALAHSAGALFHTDAVQAAGKMPIDVAALGCDLLTLSGHKIYGPKGTGVLYLRKGTQLRALHHGGPQERQRRAGTENVASLVGLGQAAVEARAWLRAGGAGQLAALRDRLESGILQAVPGASRNGGGAARTPNTANLRFHGILAEDLMIALDLAGLAVSAGSACQSGALEPSHVLRAMQLPDDEARSSVRFSLTRMVTPAEIDHAIALVSAAVAQQQNARTARSRTS